VSDGAANSTGEGETSVKVSSRGRSSNITGGSSGNEVLLKGRLGWEHFCEVEKEDEESIRYCPCHGSLKKKIGTKKICVDVEG
jgi:hypothetical protein